MFTYLDYLDFNLIEMIETHVSITSLQDMKHEQDD